MIFYLQCKKHVKIIMRDNMKASHSWYFTQFQRPLTLVNQSG